MGQNSKIEWCDHTFSPWWGCTKVSDGCKNCYAEGVAKRFGNDCWGVNGKRRMMSEAYWRQPLKWNREAEAAGVRRRVFCASMADVFEDRPELIAPRQRLFELIDATPNLDWLLLTKRPENIKRLWPFRFYDEQFNWPNIWIGTSIENQEMADQRIPELLKVQAKVRFLSCEPLLGPVDLERWMHNSGYENQDEVFLCHGCGASGTGKYFSVPTGGDDFDCQCSECGRPVEDGVVDTIGNIDWVIVGGESGSKARPMHPAWARSIRDQCMAAGTPFLFKQWGEWAPFATQAFYEKGTLWPGNDETVGGDCGGPACITHDKVSLRDGTKIKCKILKMEEHRWGKENKLRMTYCKIGKKKAGRILDGRTWDEYPEVTN